MRYYVLACDYDGTLASNGQVAEETVKALGDLRDSGRKLVLVTGRQLQDLEAVFPHLDLFERVVAENGALVYTPANHAETALAPSPPHEFVDLLSRRGVRPLSVGRVIVGTWEPYEKTALEAIRDLGLELQVIFNKGAVMILPSGVNKATGLAAALSEMKFSPHNVVGVGDAENDHAFLRECEAAVAVANALPMVKEQADWVTRGDHGGGVVELAKKLIASDLAELGSRLERHEILLGTRKRGEQVRISPYGTNTMLAGTSGSGKSTFVTSFLERLVERKYQFCVIDPEGDYESLPGAVVLGDTKRAPSVAEIRELLDKPEHNAIVNLLGIALDDQPAFFQELFPALLKLRQKTGRPHWIVIDEAHHLLSPDWRQAAGSLPRDLYGLFIITVHPEQVAPDILKSANMVIALGETPEQTIQRYSRAIGKNAPSVPAVSLKRGEAIGWCRGQEGAPFWFQSIPPKTEHQRHIRKYADGALPEDRVFYFRGPQGALHLRAQNLMTFIQMAKGVDDETWLYHLKRGDYSRWFREGVHDKELADAAEEIEQNSDQKPAQSRAAIIKEILKRYTSPAE